MEKREDELGELLHKHFNDIILLSDMPIDISRSKYSQAKSDIINLFISKLASGKLKGLIYQMLYDMALRKRIILNYKIGTKELDEEINLLISFYSHQSKQNFEEMRK